MWDSGCIRAVCHCDGVSGRAGYICKAAYVLMLPSFRMVTEYGTIKYML